MLAMKLDPDYSVPGLRYKREAGRLKGKLYTTFPRRFRSAGTNALKAGLLAFILLWMLLSIGDDPDSFIDALFIAIAIFLCSYPLFVVYDPGIRIKITKDALTVGWFRYDLSDVSSFYKITYHNKQDRMDAHCVGFRYGEREEEILVFNSSSVIEGIIPFLNRARECAEDYWRRR